MNEQNNILLFIEYMKIRASHEGVEWGLTNEQIYNLFLEGIKQNGNGVNMFGVELNKHGFPLWDDQEPVKGFLNSFIFLFFN